MQPMSRRDLLKSTVVVPAVGALGTSKKSRTQSRLADFGWIWEGQAINRFVMPSIFGVGEGAEYFGLKKVVYMFHPNTELAMKKLRRFDEVVCDISKWKFRGQADNSVLKYHDGKITTKIEEARKVADLSARHANITGGFDDDLLGTIKREGTSPQQYARVYDELKKRNSNLHLWTVVYSHELDKKNWMGFSRYMDVISFWVWHPQDLPNLDRYLDQCHKIFPGKPINVGSYLRNFPAQEPMAMDLLKLQWKKLLNYVQAGSIQGYSIIATVLIDEQQEQARWVRDCIAAN